MDTIRISSFTSKKKKRKKAITKIGLVISLIQIIGLPCLLLSALYLRFLLHQAMGTEDDHSMYNDIPNTGAAEICQESPIGNLTKRDPSKYRNHRLSLTGPGADKKLLRNNNNSATAAVCAFRKGKHSSHFPHAMQQILQCWSYWNFPVNRDKSKVFVEPSDVANFPSGPITWREWFWSTFKRKKNRNFILEFLKVLQESPAFQLKVIPGQEFFANSPTTSPYVIRRDHANTFLLGSPDDARSLRATFLEYYNVVLPDSDGGGACPASSALENNALPRIAILNRAPENYRSILNTQSIIAALKAQLAFRHVREVQFEGVSLRDQVAFFATTDLVISPHGAQLTGLPFLPPRCAGVLELFPAYYYFDLYFGSLADGAGVASYQYYLSDGDPVAEQRHTESLSVAERHAFRNVNLCPPVSAIVDAVRVMVDDWRSCCRRRQRENNETRT